MNTIELAAALEDNRQFVDNCQRIAGNPSAHRFANMEAGNDAYEAKRAFLESITSDPAVLPERAAERAKLLEEQNDERVALEVEMERARLADQRIKFNRIIEETKDTK
jgi:hypothetical protein